MSRRYTKMGRWSNGKATACNTVKIAGSIPALPSAKDVLGVNLTKGTNKLIHFTSDTHFFHANIIKYSNRPFRHVDEMNETLIANWNAVVAPNDTVWHLGDFAFCKGVEQFKTLLSRLNGTKHSILGNHDRTITNNERELLAGGHLASIQHYAEIRSDKHPMIVLLHYGMRVWNKSHHGSIMLYGHSHGSLPPHGKSVDVGVDSREISPEYRPYSLTEVLAYMAKRNFRKVDHHG